MNILYAITLGIVQGVTEFIPVSSTGHLILARYFLDLPLAGSLAFDAVLQLATGLAIIVYFWCDLKQLLVAFLSLIFRKPVFEFDKKKLFSIIIGTIPAVFLGLLLQNYMDTTFRSPIVVAIALLAGTLLFFFAEKKKKYTQLTEKEKTVQIKPSQGLIVGLFQCLALIPGLSRSGSTISGGLLIGLQREVAIRFSFLLSLPIIIGSGLKGLLELFLDPTLSEPNKSLFFAGVCAFVFGLLAIRFLVRFLKNHSLNYFGVYRAVLAIIILLLYL